MALEGSTIAEALSSIFNATTPAATTPTTESPASLPVATPAPAPASVTATGPVVLDPTAPIDPAAPVTTTPATPAPTTTSTGDGIEELPKMPELDVADLLTTQTTPAPDTTAAPTTETIAPPTDAELEFNADALEANKTYKVEGTRFKRIYAAHKAAQSVIAETGIDFRTPESISTIKQLQDTKQGFDQLLSDLSSPEDVVNVAKYTLSRDPQGTIALNLVNSILAESPEVRSEIEATMGGTSIVQTLGEVLKGISDADDQSTQSNLKGSVLWLAKRLGIDMADIEKVVPKPKLSPVELENRRLKRELEIRDSTQSKSRAAAVHAQAPIGIGRAIDTTVNDYLKALVPSVYKENLTAPLTAMKEAVILDLQAGIREALKSDPDFMAAVRTARADVDAGKITDAGKIVQIYQAKLEKLLSPSNKTSKFYTTVHRHVQETRAKIGKDVTARVTTAATVANQPVTSQSGTPVVKPEAKVIGDETPQQARERFLRGLVARP